MISIPEETRVMKMSPYTFDRLKALPIEAHLGIPNNEFARVSIETDSWMVDGKVVFIGSEGVVLGVMELSI
jgi:hypothetical protein